MKRIYAIAICFLLVCGCAQKEEEPAWSYSEVKEGGFQKVPYIGREGPGLILVQEDTLVDQDLDTVVSVPFEIDENGDTVYRRRVIRNSWKNIDYYLNNGERAYDSSQTKKVNIDAFFTDSNETGR
jgi:PBP1b-binding outer membrane lipoprotein LpoB